jgi:hypothetical protein
VRCKYLHFDQTGFKEYHFVASKFEAESAADNGKPSRNAQAPVIRRLEIAEEDAKTRLLKRQVPAWVISGLIHVVLITAFIIADRYFFKEVDAKEKIKDYQVNTKIDEPVEVVKDLTNPDEGLDSELSAAVEVNEEADLNVQAPVVDNEPKGLPDNVKDFANQTANLGADSKILDTAGINSPELGVGPSARGDGGMGSQLALPGMAGRTGATKAKLLKEGGGNDKTEAAVGAALAWLAKQQKSEGYWEFDGSHKDDRVAATGMCILPFLAAGETHMTGKKYRTTVRKGLEYLKSQLKNGQFSTSMYSQAIATMAMCEAAGMTQDDSMKNAARRAVDFIVKAQGANGSWGYSASTQGDTSIVGWQIQALKSAKLAGISVPEKSFKQADSFLLSVSDDSESSYGYASKGGSHTLSAVGLLSRIYIHNNSKLPYVAKGVTNMWTNNKPVEGNWDLYYYYYATQVVHFFDGPKWHKDWNPTMQQIILNKQITDATPNAKKGDIGSFVKDTGFIGSSCGKLGSTALACLTLEVYYRHLPLGKREAVGNLADREKMN